MVYRQKRIAKTLFGRAEEYNTIRYFCNLLHHWICECFCTLYNCNGIGELIPQLTGEFQLWYDNNAWLAPKLVILSHQKLLLFLIRTFSPKQLGFISKTYIVSQNDISFSKYFMIFCPNLHIYTTGIF